MAVVDAAGTTVVDAPWAGEEACVATVTDELVELMLAGSVCREHGPNPLVGARQLMCLGLSMVVRRRRVPGIRMFRIKLKKIYHRRVYRH